MSTTDTSWAAANGIKVTEISRGSAHRRQVAYVRASLLRGVDYRDKPSDRLRRR